jgi:hypothetical protein
MHHQPHSLALLRSDYLLHAPPDSDVVPTEAGIKQVEINTIASSFAGLSVGMRRSDYEVSFPL